MNQPSPIEESHQLISRLERIEHMIRVCLGSLQCEKIAENESVEAVLNIVAFEAFELIEEQRAKEVNA